VIGLETRKLIPYWLSKEEEEESDQRAAESNGDGKLKEVDTAESASAVTTPSPAAESEENPEMQCIPYSKAVKAAMKGSRVVNCNGHRLPLALVAPDVAMASVRYASVSAQDRITFR
jgi:hypothetical protein